MVVDFLSGAPHFAAHLYPVYRALPRKARGAFLRRHGVAMTPMGGGSLSSPVGGTRGNMVCVASFSDYKNCCARKLVALEIGHVLRVDPPKKPVVVFEHGAGFTYDGAPKKKRMSGTGVGPGGSYAGGHGRHWAALFPATNEWVSRANLLAEPDIPSPIVGCPKLDDLVQIPRPQNEQPTVAISFHYEIKWLPETRSAFPHYEPGLASFAKKAQDAGWRVIGHGHPRAQEMLRPVWEELGWEFAKSFEKGVVPQADVYVVDTSSTLYEFAALDRPVVVLDAPWYREGVNHGIRFWDHADVGVRIQEPEDLFDAVSQALADKPDQRNLRHAAVSAIYPYLGHSAERAVEVLRDFWINR